MKGQHWETGGIYSLLRQYRDNSNSLIGWAVSVGTAIDGSNRSLSCTHAFEVRENSIYLTLFSDFVTFIEGNDPEEFTDPCNGHLLVNVSAEEVIPVAWTGALCKECDQCSKLLQVGSYQGPPNGNEKVDSKLGCMLAKQQIKLLMEMEEDG
ncbi:uncharacterized protein J3R85_016070 [Psidium guajava]|nr:uncharacterized protein J3R85_016070 [Psidium guajava]